jgi:two-component system LytT family sensor kinase
MCQFGAGFLLSLALRKYYQTVPFQNLGLAPLVFRISIASFFAAVVSYYSWFFIEWFIFGNKLLTYASSFFRSAQIVAVSFPDKVAWSALYFGIKLWREWSIQRDLADSATETAHAARLQILRYQLNPQFLFNALHTVRELIDEDARGAKRVITDLSDFLRYSLVNRERLTVTLSEEFAAIRQYLAIEQRRLEVRLRVSIVIAPETEQILLPGFSIQPFIEHALRKALSETSDPVSLEVNVQRNGNEISIAVTRTDTHPELQISPQDIDEQARLQTELESRLSSAFGGRATLQNIRSNGSADLVLVIHEPEGESYGENHSRADR